MVLNDSPVDCQIHEPAPSQRGESTRDNIKRLLSYLVLLCQVASQGAVVNDCQWQSEPRRAFPQKSESTLIYKS